MRNICKIQACDHFVHGHGNCVKHYKQLTRHGKLFNTGYDDRPAILREDHALIPLGINAKDGYTIVDIEDAHLADKKWVLSDGYAKTALKRKVMKIHMLITEKRPGLEVDHKNRNKLDNRKLNLRYATHQENTFNTKQRENITGYRGVKICKPVNKFIAQITFNGKYYYLGLFENKEDAAMAYDKKSKEFHGEYGVLNFGGNSHAC